MIRSAVEIHCPTCGVLIRECKAYKACPDCDNVQAIVLEYNERVSKDIEQRNREAMKGFDDSTD